MSSRATIPASIHGPAAALLAPWFRDLTGTELIAAIKHYRECNPTLSRELKPGKLLKIKEVAERLGISRASVFNLLTQGALPRIKVGASTRIPEQAVVAISTRDLLEGEQS